MTIIDVRTKEEYEAGHIKDSKLFDIMDMMNGVFPQFPKDTSIMVYCESGNRATMAQSMMSIYGFTSVENGGGVEDMVAHGYELI